MESLQLKIRFCLQPWFEFEDISLKSVLEGLFHYASSFQKLQNLDVKASFVEPESQYMEFVREQALDTGILEETDDEDDADEIDSAEVDSNEIDSDDDDSEGDSNEVNFEVEAAQMLVRPETTAADLALFYGDAYGLDGSMLNTMFAKCHSRMLLGWLSHQRQLPQSCLSTYLHGPCVVYGLLPELLMEARQRLNVNLVCEVQNLYCHTNPNRPWNPLYREHVFVHLSYWPQDPVDGRLRLLRGNGVWSNKSDIQTVFRANGSLPSSDTDELRQDYQLQRPSSIQWQSMLEPRKAGNVSRVNYADILAGKREQGQRVGK